MADDGSRPERKQGAAAAQSHFSSMASEWAGFYDARESFRTRLSIVNEVIASLPGSVETVLDFGSGGGVFSALISERASRVLALDTNLEMAKSARKNDGMLTTVVGRLGVQYLPGRVSHVTGTLDCLAPHYTVDLAMAIAVIEYLPHPDEALRLLGSFLKPDGVILLTYPHEKSFLRRVERPVNRLVARLGRAIGSSRLSRREYSALHPSSPGDLLDIIEYAELSVVSRFAVPLGRRGLRQFLVPNRLWVLAQKQPRPEH